MIYEEVLINHRVYSRGHFPDMNDDKLKFAVWYEQFLNHKMAIYKKSVFS